MASSAGVVSLGSVSPGNSLRDVVSSSGLVKDARGTPLGLKPLRAWAVGFREIVEGFTGSGTGTSGCRGGDFVSGARTANGAAGGCSSIDVNLV